MFCSTAIKVLTTPRIPCPLLVYPRWGFEAEIRDSALSLLGVLSIYQVPDDLNTSFPIGILSVQIRRLVRVCGSLAILHTAPIASCRNTHAKLLISSWSTLQVRIRCWDFFPGVIPPKLMLVPAVDSGESYRWYPRASHGLLQSCIDVLGPLHRIPNLNFFMFTIEKCLYLAPCWQLL